MNQMMSGDSCRFVRVPETIFAMLLRTTLSARDYRLLLWVIRETFGWSRTSTPCTWYRIGKELLADCASVYHAAKRFIRSALFIHSDGRLCIAFSDGSLSVGSEPRW